MSSLALSNYLLFSFSSLVARVVCTTRRLSFTLFRGWCSYTAANECDIRMRLISISMCFINAEFHSISGCVIWKNVPNFRRRVTHWINNIAFFIHFEWKKRFWCRFKISTSILFLVPRHLFNRTVKYKFFRRILFTAWMFCDWFFFQLKIFS